MYNLNSSGVENSANHHHDCFESIDHVHTDVGEERDMELWGNPGISSSGIDEPVDRLG